MTNHPTFVLVLQALLLPLCGLLFHVLLCFLLAPVWPPLCPLFPPKKRTYNSITDPFYVSFESKLMDFKYLLDFKYLDYLDYLLDFKYFGLEKKIACSIFTDVRLKWPFLNIYLFILFVFCFIQQNVKLKPPQTE